MTRFHFVLPAKAFRFCVYVLKRSTTPDEPDRVLYVGMSSHGVRRFGNHGMLPEYFENEDYMEVYPCLNREEAELLEAEFIRVLAPEKNRNRPTLKRYDSSR